MYHLVRLNGIGPLSETLLVGNLGFPGVGNLHLQSFGKTAIDASSMSITNASITVQTNTSRAFDSQSQIAGTMDLLFSY
jgi:hypothetical protein